jgi:hypothetical protein
MRNRTEVSLSDAGCVSLVGGPVCLHCPDVKSVFFVLVIFVDAVYKKHYPPALNDEVWRLDKIGKDGAFHKRLNKAGLWSVEDFLRLVVMDPQRLRNVSPCSVMIVVRTL